LNLLASISDNKKNDGVFTQKHLKLGTLSRMAKIRKLKSQPNYSINRRMAYGEVRGRSTHSFWMAAYVLLGTIFAFMFTGRTDFNLPRAVKCYEATEDRERYSSTQTQSPRWNKMHS
jgi:hypothetical protein